jgi:hypothetical protein
MAFRIPVPKVLLRYCVSFHAAAGMVPALR